MDSQKTNRENVEIRPRIVDVIAEFFTPVSKKDSSQANERMLLLANRLKGRGLLLTLFDKSQTRREFYIALKIICDIEDILDSGGNYETAFRSVAYSDYDLANLVFIWHLEDSTRLKIYNEVQLQAIAKIQIKYMKEIRNSYLMAMEAQYRIDLEKILAKGGTYDDLLKTNPEDYGLSNSWESTFYYPKTKDGLILAVFNRYTSINNPKDLMSFTLPSLAEIGKGHRSFVWDLIREAILSLPPQDGGKMKH